LRPGEEFRRSSRRPVKEPESLPLFRQTRLGVSNLLEEILLRRTEDGPRLRAEIMPCGSTYQGPAIWPGLGIAQTIALELEMGATRDRESEKRTNADGDALDQTHVLLLPTLRGEGVSPRSQPICATPFEGTCGT